MPALLMGPVGKLLGILALVLALIGFGEWHGRQAVQQRWDAAIAQQAMKSAETVIHEAENTAKVETQFERTVQAQSERVKIVTREVKVYVDGPAKKCEESPEFVRTFDAVSGMHDRATDGLPAAPSPPGAAPVVPEAPVTDVAVLGAYASCAEQLFSLWDTYGALVEWTRSSYDLAKDGAGR